MEGAEELVTPLSDEAATDPRPAAQHDRVLRQADLPGGVAAAGPHRHLRLPRGAARGEMQQTF